MTGWQIGFAIYCAIGALLVSEIMGAPDLNVKARAGSFRWYAGGIIAGTLVSVFWLPIVVFAMIWGDDAKD